MSIADKIQGINNKIEQNKAQYNLDGQTAKKIVEKQYQEINKTDEKEEPVKITKVKPEIVHELKLSCVNKYNFSDYKNVRNFSDISHGLNRFRNFMPRTEKNRN